jgi:hypothetical protein
MLQTVALKRFVFLLKINPISLFSSILSLLFLKTLNYFLNLSKPFVFALVIIDETINQLPMDEIQKLNCLRES